MPNRAARAFSFNSYRHSFVGSKFRAGIFPATQKARRWTRWVGTPTNSKPKKYSEIGFGKQLRRSKRNSKHHVPRETSLRQLAVARRQEPLCLKSCTRNARTPPVPSRFVGWREASSFVFGPSLRPQTRRTKALLRSSEFPE